jgi:predicted GIY-YIG superfamily endonuclease
VTHYVYLLRCADNSLYVGETSDLATRERHHNEGRGGSYTAKRRPVQIVYAEQYSSREDALGRARQIKRWSSQKKRSPR